MIEYLRNLLGMGPSKPNNVIERSNTIERKIDTSKYQKKESEKVAQEDTLIYPILTSSKNTNYDLYDQMVAIIHERDNAYSKLISIQLLLEPVNEEEYELSQVKTDNMSDETYFSFRKQAEKQFESFDQSFIFWDLEDAKLEFKVLSSKLSIFSPTKLISPKHMKEAHQLLDAEEIVVSIPKDELILVCDYNISEEHLDQFVKMHAGIFLQAVENGDALCEDLFLLKEGEISAVKSYEQLSEIALKK